MSLLSFTILVIFGVATSQNHDVNPQIPYKGRSRQSSVEANNTTFPSDSTVENEGIQLILTCLETLYVEKLDYLITDTNRRFQSLENHIENLEAKMDNLGKNIQQLMDSTRNLSSENDSSLINVTSSLASSNSELKQIFNEGLEKLKDLQTVTLNSCPHKFTLDKQYPRNCREAREFKKTASGNYMIKPEHALHPFEAVCDLDTMGGGWTVIQSRFDGSQDFYLDLKEYKKGFGNLGGEFWLGLENIHLLTGFETNELLIELGDFESQNKSAFYSEFSIGSEVEGYSLQVLGAYSGDGGDSLTYSAGRQFSTKDNDQDGHPSLQCAQYMSGAWWYDNCAFCNLNGKYFGRGQVPENKNQGVFWYHFKNYTSLQHTRMSVRPKV